MKAFRPWMIFLLFSAAVTGSIMMVSQFAETAPVIVSGSLKIRSDLKSHVPGHNHLFVVLFDQESPMPMPYAAARYRVSSNTEQKGEFFSFFLTEQNTQIMNPGGQRPKRLRVKARLDQDGVAGPDQPGDLTGEISDILWGTKGIEIEIDTLKRS